MGSHGYKYFQEITTCFFFCCLKKNLNTTSRPSEYPPVRSEYQNGGIYSRLQRQKFFVGIPFILDVRLHLSVSHLNRENISADYEQDWQPYPVDPYSCYMYFQHACPLHTISGRGKERHILIGSW